MGAISALHSCVYQIVNMGLFFFLNFSTAFLKDILFSFVLFFSFCFYTILLLFFFFMLGIQPGASPSPPTSCLVIFFYFYQMKKKSPHIMRSLVHRIIWDLFLPLAECLPLSVFRIEFIQLVKVGLNNQFLGDQKL